MSTRRVATAAALLALLGAACGSSGATRVAARGDAIVTPTPAAQVAEPTTTIALPATEPASKPVVKATPKPATIEVDYQPLGGATAIATVSGPNDSRSKSLDSGTALFGGLADGTYSVTITVDSPSGGPSIGTAEQIINAGNVRVEAGDSGVITCDDNGCTGAL